MKSDLEIAREHEARPIDEVAASLGLGAEEIKRYGARQAKVRRSALDDRDGGDGRLVLVTGMSPTRAGEGKTTVAIGLADALRMEGERVVVCLREPSLGPVFGIKGGATGGGYSQLLPMKEINLHFTGDLHAISSAHSLLSAMVDNHLHHGNPSGLDPRRVIWKRAVDMNDRALRKTVVGLGGPAGGVPREDGYLITAASEVMAIFCLAEDFADLQERLGRIVVGATGERDLVTAGDLDAEGAMGLLLQDAMDPNLVQTLEGTPALVHGGPFANIAHGCNSLAATRAGLALGDVVVTEAGFGADLGAEKFFDIKCRAGGLEPEAAVVVATIRALRHHGDGEAGGDPDPDAVRRGCDNLLHHVSTVRRFGVPPVVAVNRFPDDTGEELAAVKKRCREEGVPVAVSEAHARGGEGARPLARALVETLEEGGADFRPLYPDELPLAEKLDTVARRVYGADGIELTSEARRDAERLEELGMGDLPVCIAKTPASLSDDPSLRGRPRGFRITVRDLTPSAGAGFVVARTGDVMVMPGFPERPAAEGMRVEPDGTVRGLF
jgi:formate--tetrahydrofolate ligase